MTNTLQSLVTVVGQQPMIIMRNRNDDDDNDGSSDVCYNDVTPRGGVDPR